MRTRSIVVPALTALAAALLSVPVVAQSEPRAPLPPLPPGHPAAPPSPDGMRPPRLVGPRFEREIIRRRMGDDSTWRKQATLGMSLSATGSKRDTLGIFVSRVVPNGPAERAGIVEGDRIAAINDVDLRLSAGDAEDAYTAGVPAHRLSRTVSKLKAGNTVSLRVYSNGRYRNATVTAATMSDVYKDPQRLMISLGDINEMVAPALGQMEIALDRIGPELDRMRPELERIGPAVRAEVERAMDSLPRDVHVEITHSTKP